MDKETVFKEIRRQQVLLWAGAGFSRYADYPMGKGVVERLYAELSTQQQQQLATTLNQEKPECPTWMPLPDFAQQFVNLHYDNRQQLVAVLDSIFSKTPTSRSVHDKLASIAFIDKIVTTNYDLLFELAYGSQRLHVVTQASNVPQGSSKDVTLYKIHGELRNPESLIITKDDYYGFFEKADDIVWTQLRALMATRTIVFVGYAVEDPNVLDVFLTTLSKLGKLMRPAYVVGPEMPQMRVQELIRKNIHFIQATGGEFIDDLLEDIKKHALNDLLKDGAALVRPVSKTLSNLGLKCDMTIDGSGYLVKDIERQEGQTLRKLSIATGAVDAKQALNDFFKGLSAKPVKLELNSLNRIRRTVEGFVLPDIEQGEVTLMRTPAWQGIADIKFESGLLIKDVSIRTFPNINTFQVVVIAKYYRLEISVTPTKNKLHFDIYTYYQWRGSSFNDLDGAREYIDFMAELGGTGSFDVMQHGQIIWSSVSKGKRTSPSRNDFLKQSSGLRKLLEALYFIENKLSINFRKFTFNGMMVDEIVMLYRILNGEVFITKFNTIWETDNNKHNEDEIMSAVKKKEPLLTEHTFDEEFDILGWKIRVKWTESQILDNPILQKKTKDFIRVKSASKQLTRHCTSVISTEIISRPNWIEDIPLSEEERREEEVPRH